MWYFPRSRFAFRVTIVTTVTTALLATWFIVTSGTGKRRAASMVAPPTTTAAVSALEAPADPYALFGHSIESITQQPELMDLVSAWVTQIIADHRFASLAGDHGCLTFALVLNETGDERLHEFLDALERGGVAPDTRRRATMYAATSAWMSGKDAVAREYFESALRLTEPDVPSQDRSLALNDRLRALLFMQQDAAKRGDRQRELDFGRMKYEATSTRHGEPESFLFPRQRVAIGYAELLARRGDRQQAVEVMNKLLADCPECGRAEGQRLWWIARKASFLDIGSNERGFSDIYEEILLHPDFAASQDASTFANNLASSYGSQSRLDAAMLTWRYVEMLAAAAATDPAVPAERRVLERDRASLAALKVAEILLRQGKLDEGILQLEYTLKEHPNADSTPAAMRRLDFELRSRPVLGASSTVGTDLVAPHE